MNTSSSVALSMKRKEITIKDNAYKDANWVRLPSSGGTRPVKLLMPRLLFLVQKL